MQLLSRIAALPHQNYVLSLLQASSSASCVLGVLLAFWKAGLVWKECRSAVGRLKRMYQSPTPHQTQGVIQNIYSFWLCLWCFIVWRVSLGFRV